MLLLSTISETLWRAWLYVTHTRSLAIGLGVAFAILALVLLVASRTRWGQAKPLTKCVVLSVLAHVWLLMYALGSRTVLPQGSPTGQQTSMSVAFEQDPSSAIPALQDDALNPKSSNSDNSQSSELESDAETYAPSAWEQSATLQELPQPPALSQALTRSFLSAPALLPLADPTPLPPLPAPLPAPRAETDTATEPQPTTAEALAQSAAQPIASQLDQASVVPQTSESSASEALQPLAPPTTITPPSSALSAAASAGPPMQAVAMQQSPVLPPIAPLPDNPNLPAEYRLRQAPNRLQVATPYGADQDSEAAVESGLAWLAAAQSSDGSWNAKQYGAGTETYALGEARYGTGDKADTGVSGLALLAFLSAGHTHLDGKYQQNVAQGLGFLLRSQMRTGVLSGLKQVGDKDLGVLNARMYCHSIASLAVAEAYAMTGDAVLREPLLRAAQYSINAQDPRGGGWRYSPGDPGDLSQFGWQAMALKSVQRSGLQIPRDVTQRMQLFLDSCAAGASGGLATYRPRDGRPSATMTAECLACRLLLDHPGSLAAQQEALQMIMQQRPGSGEENVYYWYYATLALFQLQDQNWREWNQALKQQLLRSQAPAYAPQAGSWEPDRTWGGYGGRVYSTAMSCLCLEVYYRYLPMYQRTNTARASDSLSLPR